MKNTGLFFFIMRTTRLIVAMFVLFAICQPAVATVALKGAENLAPECGPKIEALCKNETAGTLEQIDVTLRDCEVTCTYRLRGERTVYRNGFFVQNIDSAVVKLPQGMPCAFGAECDIHGKCFCSFCNKMGGK
uniref:Putative salp15 n=1 Tax=Ixodes ricinus TaxID=34613 RepID=A0A0K8RMY6_IXORI